jgi:hypothetical protein
MSNNETSKEPVDPSTDTVVLLDSKEDNQVTRQDYENFENETNLNNGYLSQSWSIYKNFRY